MSGEGTPSKDLVVLVPDKNTEHAIRGLFGRQSSLGVRGFSYDLFVHPERDPGCLLRAHTFLQTFAKRYVHALVVFDHEGCGKQNMSPTELQREVENNLSQWGWAARSAAVAISPELETWVWSDSPEVDRALGWSGKRPDLRTWLREKNLLTAVGPKPTLPKESMEQALREVRKPRSSAIYRELAEKVSVSRCVDPAFVRLKNTLVNWFPAP